MSVPEAKVHDFGSLAEYRDGSVVSRQLLKSEAGSVTLFAFDSGEGLSEHTTPFDALVHVLDGVARIEIAGQRSGVGAGQMIILPAGVPHSVHAEGRFRMLLTMLRG